MIFCKILVARFSQTQAAGRKSKVKSQNYPHANPGLDEVANEVYHVVRDWIIQHLNRSSVTLI